MKMEPNHFETWLRICLTRFYVIEKNNTDRSKVECSFQSRKIWYASSNHLQNLYNLNPWLLVISFYLPTSTSTSLW